MSERIQPGLAMSMHLDADQLAAFLEDSLPEHEHVLALAHLAECPSCREVAFLAQEAATEAAPRIVQPEPLPERKPFWSKWFMPLPLAGAGALAATLLLFAVWRHRPMERFAGVQQAKTEPASRLQAEEQIATASPAPPALSQADRLAAEIKPGTAMENKLTNAEDVLASPPKPETKQSREAADRTQMVTAGLSASPNAVSLGSSQLSDKAQLSQQSHDAAAAPPPPRPQIAAAAPVAAQPAAVAQDLPVEGRNMAKLPIPAPVSGAAPRIAAKQAAVVPSVTGHVLDASGAIVPGATVTLRFAGKSPAETPEAQTKTAGDGQFALAAVAPGKYDLQVTSPGFQTFNREVDLQQHASLQVQPVLSVGEAAQIVEVTAASAEIRTSSAYANGKIMAEASLPSGLSSVATATAGGSTLELDSAGNLFLMRGSHKWKQITATWASKALQVRTIPGQSEGFQLTTDSGATWVSGDGERWRQIKHPPSAQNPQK